MALSLFRTLLLVVATMGLAQARHMTATTVVNYVVTSSLPTIGVARNESSYQIYKNNNTNSNNNATSILGANAEYPSQTALNLEDNGNGDAFTVNISTSQSVVQDWSLVCQQLCGAGLGGAPCLAYCHSSDKPSLLPAFDGSRHEICKDLCRLQLGDVSCNCTNEVESTISFANMTIQYELGNEVCGSFCEHSGATLIGCSNCQLNDNKMQIAKSAAAESATPDWKELCASLCKTGDGGALCSCDLAPFF